MAIHKNKTIENIFLEDGRYPLEAVQFVREGLNYTVNHVHGEQIDPQERHHVSGAQLCEGLRQLALQRWGLMAKSVLNLWNVKQTRDFGEIIFLLVENDWMQKEPCDCIEDFDEVYDFSYAFGIGYRIALD